ncbi:hypothetical protein EXU85_32900 [Spirosoma sp. KCTC 42546]|uniref:hypothetical protein n=1 Tax=Spirosoma sp. KCTC 42546 TaxID=2520506 RepID=UPI00115A0911|nr:hypothetical protein [Spirosoma sp. KCTC 42546]QDK83145.1 hypothetical protein EXU85_32900 [Spirosoma sp. KCTC 42546]
MIRSLLLFSLLTSFLGACNPERVHYTSELKAEMADSKIKRITNADLIETVDNLGTKVSVAVEKELTTQLQKTTNPAERAKLCQLQNLPRTKAIAENYALDIRLLGEADIQNKGLSTKEREILDAYLYGTKQKMVSSSNIQKITDTTFVYNVPVAVNSLICAACFSNQETPFAVWHLGFKKREVVRRMSDTKKKKQS